MILDSFDNAESDFEQRQLIEARVEADDILARVEKAKTHPVWAQLSYEEQTEIGSVVDELHVLKQGEDRAAIRGSIEALDKATRRLAELMMDQTLTTAMSGKTMESAGEKLGEGPSAPHPFAKAEIE